MPRTLIQPLLRVPVIFAPERAHRPQPPPIVASLEPSECPVCPGAESATPPEILRTGGGQWQQRLFTNKYPILDSAAHGSHEVLVEARTHDEISDEHSIAEVLRIYQSRIQAHRERHESISIFKNRGRWGGESISHPHSQIVAMPFISPRGRTELDSFRSARSCPLCLGAADREFRVRSGTSVALFVPSVPRFGFEIWIAPTRHENRFEDTTGETVRETAAMMRAAIDALVTGTIARSWNWGVITAPFHEDAGGFHWYIELLPRTSALAGFELQTGCFINVVTPEESLTRYRSLIER